MKIYISGSLAYDRIMDFPGRFSDHILPEKIHILNVCFTINGLRENFGGTAGNIAYTLSLLGERPVVIASAGRDFGAYRDWLEKNNLSTEHVTIVNDEVTAGAYITTDKSDNQITAFNPGAMRCRSTFDFRALAPEESLAVIAPGNLGDMHLFAQVCKREKIAYLFDPGQSLPAWTAEQLCQMIDGSKIFISNDYELEMALKTTGLRLEDILPMTGTLITTLGEQGSVIRSLENGSVKSVQIPAAKPDKVCDPTGAGDAYRAGLLKGLLLPQKDIVHAARMGSVSASYAVEGYGTQTFHFTRDSFNQRFSTVFGATAY